jgi:hypothetical protein
MSLSTLPFSISILCISSCWENVRDDKKMASENTKKTTVFVLTTEFTPKGDLSDYINITDASMQHTIAIGTILAHVVDGNAEQVSLLSTGADVHGDYDPR